MPLPLLIPAIAGAAGSIFGGIFGGAKKREAEERARREVAERKQRLSDYYNHESGLDILDTSSAQSTLRALRKQNDKAAEASNNNMVKSGATDEARVAVAERLNSNYADAVSRIAGMGEQRRQQLEQMHFSGQNDISAASANIDYQSALDKSQAMANWGNQVSNIAGLGMSLYGQGAFSKSKSPNEQYGESIIGTGLNY